MADDPSNNGGSCGLDIAGVLGVAFVVLKLCGVIDWSWWWVTAPFWGVPVILVAVLVIYGVCCGVIRLLCWVIDRVVR